MRDNNLGLDILIFEDAKMKNTIDIGDLKLSDLETRAEILIGVAPPSLANVEDQTEEISA